MRDKKTARGDILPLALVMTVMIVMAGIGIGTVVLEGAQRALDVDRSISAYYMADSGIERMLYEVRKVGAPVSSLTSLSSTYPNGTSWNFASGFETETSKSVASVASSSFAVVDLFDPDNVGPAGVDHVVVDWQNGADCGAATANLSVGYAEWNLQGNIVPSNFTIVENPDAVVDGPPVNQSLTVPLDVNRAYRLRLTPDHCGVSDVTVTAYDASNAPVSFPGDITLAAEGTYGATTQKIAVTMPKLDVLSGLFSYVVFTECTLVKQQGVTPTCPP